MSYYHPTSMHPALSAHHEEMRHRLVSDPVVLPAAGSVPALQYHSGPTLKNGPKTVALYAGQFWADIAKTNQCIQDLTEGGYLSLLRPLGSDNGKYLGNFAIPAPPSGDILDADCRDMIARAIAANGNIPRPDLNTIYLLLLPDGVQVSFDQTRSQRSCREWCAYHSNSDAFLYAVHPASTCGGCNQGDPFAGLTMVLSHEIAEACSDPTGQGWFNDQTGDETSDEVAWIAKQYGPWTVQGYAAPDATGAWVNAVGPYAPQTGGGGQGWQPDPVLQRLYAWEQQATAYIAAQYALNSAAGAAEARKWQQALTETAIQFFPYVHGRSSLRSVDDMVRLPGVPQ